MESESVSLQELINRELESSDFALPVFNEVALKLQNALGEEDITIEDIEELILEDPALASQILRMANSAFYKGLGEIDTIKRAILRLGSEQVASIAMLASQKQGYTSDNQQILSYLEKLWKYSFACALGCKWIAQNTGYASDASVAFLSGLLHDVGKLVILKVVEHIQARDGESAVFNDRAIFEILESSLHNECGHTLIQAWNLPEPYGSVVRDHHLAEPRDNQLLLATVRLMNMVCDTMGLGLTESDAVLPAASAEAQMLGLSEIKLAELEVHLEDALEMEVDF